MPKWEYRVEIIDTTGCYQITPPDMVGDPYGPDFNHGEWGKINNLGAEGWELVSANWEGDEGIAVFKREPRALRPWTMEAK
jgi:hypothetical protein